MPHCSTGVYFGNSIGGPAWIWDTFAFRIVIWQYTGGFCLSASCDLCCWNGFVYTWCISIFTIQFYFLYHKQFIACSAGATVSDNVVASLIFSAKNSLANAWNRGLGVRGHPPQNCKAQEIFWYPHQTLYKKHQKNHILYCCIFQFFLRQNFQIFIFDFWHPSEFLG